MGQFPQPDRVAGPPSVPWAPESALDCEGRPVLGAFRGTIARPTLEAWASPLVRRLRRKRWQYVAVASDSLVASAAVAHLGYVGAAFVVVWDRAGRRWFEAETLSPLALGMRVAGGPEAGSLSFSGRRGHVHMVNEPGPTPGAGIRHVEARMQGRSGPIRLEWTVRAPAGGFEPLACVSRLRPSGLNVTHKAAGLVTSGEIEAGGTLHRLDPRSTRALLDWTEGYPPRATAWRWAIGAGRASDDTEVGFNLCAGFNDADHTENAVWIGGRLVTLGRVEFTVPGEGAPGAWTIRSEDGRLALRFTPEAMRAADEDFLVVKSRYRQPVGQFEGTVPDGLGGALTLRTVPGVAEDHEARW